MQSHSEVIHIVEPSKLQASQAVGNRFKLWLGHVLCSKGKHLTHFQVDKFKVTVKDHVSTRTSRGMIRTTYYQSVTEVLP